MFTERFMGTPARNPEGYNTSGISDVTGFRNTDFLLVHGTADINVHFANSAHLLDMLTQARVRRFDFRMFVDR